MVVDLDEIFVTVNCTICHSIKFQFGKCSNILWLLTFVPLKSIDNMKILLLTFFNKKISNKFIKVFTLTVFSDISQDKKVALLRPEGDGGGRQFSGFQATYEISVHNFWRSGFFVNFQQIYLLNFERKKKQYLRIWVRNQISGASALLRNSSFS